MSDKDFAEGIYFNDKHERAPDFVLGSISLQPSRFIEWLRAQPVSEKGYVRLSVLRSKAGKPYVVLDTWEPGKGEAEKPAENFDDDQIPF